MTLSTCCGAVHWESESGGGGGDGDVQLSNVEMKVFKMTGK